MVLPSHAESLNLPPLPHQAATKGLERTRELYDAALQERREAYEKAGKTITAFEQMRALVQVTLTPTS